LFDIFEVPEDDEDEDPKPDALELRLEAELALPSGMRTEPLHAVSKKARRPTTMRLKLRFVNFAITTAPVSSFCKTEAERCLNSFLP
jgi:hypothetical protein